MVKLRKVLQERNWTQAVAAKHCGVSQPRLNDLMRGRIDKFSIDALVNMAAGLGLRITVELRAA